MQSWISSRLNFGGIFDLDKKKRRLEELAIAAENPAVWAKPAEMQKLNKEKSILDKACAEWGQFYNKLQDCLIATDRDWSKCQEEVKKWKQCFVEKQKNKQQQQP